MSMEIKNARLKKGLISREVAEIVGRCPSWMSRVENFQCTYISQEEAATLEKTLDIVLFNTKNNDYLLKMIKDLQEENRLLKDLLTEKWKGEK